MSKPEAMSAEREVVLQGPTEPIWDALHRHHRIVAESPCDKIAAEQERDSAVTACEEGNEIVNELRAALAAANQRADEAFNSTPKQLVSDELVELRCEHGEPACWSNKIARELQQWRKWAKERPTGKAGE